MDFIMFVSDISLQPILNKKVTKSGSKLSYYFWRALLLSKLTDQDLPVALKNFSDDHLFPWQITAY